MIIHPVVHVIHTTPYVSQPGDICETILERPDIFPFPEGVEHFVQEASNHRNRGKGYHWITLMKGEPTQEKNGCLL